MHRRNFLKLGVGSAVATALIGVLPVVPYDGYQAFLGSIGKRIHEIVLREGSPIKSVLIERAFEMDGEHYWRLVKVHLEGQDKPHAWFEPVTY
jgi:hypothetical protein